MRKNFKPKELLTITALVISVLVCHSQTRELVWSDEFDYTGLPDKDKWVMQTGGGGWGNAELQYYTDREENVYVDNDVLTITALEESFASNDYTSARLTTQGLHAWKHGRIEARLKLPYSRAMWPAFWAMGSSIEEVGWPECGEIDILEVFCDGGENDSIVLNTAHWDNNGSYASYGSGSFDSWKDPYVSSSPQEFHVYALEWDDISDNMTFYVDDELAFRIDIDPNTMSEFHQEFFIILNLAVGGNKFPWMNGALYSPDASTVFPQTMVIDYVRVYSNPSYHNITGDSMAVKGQANMIYSLPYDTTFAYNWIIPAGSELSGGGLDSNFVSVDWSCDSDSIKCELTTPSGTYYLSKYVDASKENSIASDGYFVDSNQTDIEFEVIEVSEGKYKWTAPSGASIIGSDSSSMVTIDWGVAGGVVSCQIFGPCDTLLLTKNMRISGQGSQVPYPADIAHILPGSILATDFDYGGEGVAYHDSNEENQGPGPREDEGVDTEYADNGGPNVGWIIAGEWIEYTISVEDTVELFVELRAASQPGGGPMTILIDGEDRMGEFDIPSTGAWDEFMSIYPGKISLYPSDTIMRYNFVGGGYNIGTITFHELDTEAPSPISNLSITPSGKYAALIWNAATDNKLVLEYEVYVDDILKETVSDTSVTITDLTPETTYTAEIVAVDWQGNKSEGVSQNFTTTDNSSNKVLNESMVSIYPNPVHDFISIESEIAVTSVVIIDNLGRNLIETNGEFAQIDVSSLHAGIYYIIIKTENNGHLTKPFIKK